MPARSSALLLAALLALGAAAPATGQTVRGRVVDAVTRAPLPGATVVVLRSDPLRGTTADADGWFVLDRVPLGRHDLQVSMIGYEPVVRPAVLVTAGREVVLTVPLRERVLQGAEVVVTPALQKDQPLNDQAFVSARAFSVEETRRYAGGVDDPARMAAAFAGIAGGTGVQHNALVVRGNAPKGVLWRLEGVDIPNPNHFAGLAVAGGGGLTLFSSQLLADADVLTGAFPAEYGNALAGVFDLRFRTGHPTRREHAAQLGVLGVEAASEGPFVRGRPATYLFNYRYSTLGLLLPLLPTEDGATYQDLSFKLNLPTRRRGRFAVWGLGGLDRQTGSAERDSTRWRYETWDRLDTALDLGVGAAGLSHDLLLGPRTLLHTTLAATVHRTAVEQQRIGRDLVLRRDLAIRTTEARGIAAVTLSHRAAPGHTGRVGAAVHALRYDLDVRTAPGHAPPLVPVAVERGRSTLVQAFAQSRHALSARWDVTAGVHVQHVALTGQTVVEPRLGLRRAVGDAGAVSAGYGLHSQMEDLRLYLVRPRAGAGTPNRRLGLARAHHLVLGYDRRLGPQTRLKLEAYHQHLFDVPVVADSAFSLLNFEQQDFTFREALVNGGAGRNTGLEGTLERWLGDGYYYLVTAAVFRSRYRGGDGVWRGTRFDRGVTADVLAGREFTVGGDDVLGLNGRLAVLGGARRSPVDHAASRAREEVVLDAHRAFAERERTLVLADLTVTYRRNHRRRAGTWALQVKNVLAAKEAYPAYNFATREVDEVEEGFPLPVLSYKIEF